MESVLGGRINSYWELGFYWCRMRFWGGRSKAGICCEWFIYILGLMYICKYNKPFLPWLSTFAIWACDICTAFVHLKRVISAWLSQKLNQCTKSNRWCSSYRSRSCWDNALNCWSVCCLNQNCLFCSPAKERGSISDGIVTTILKHTWKL